jgi:hypothetical protein
MKRLLIEPLKRRLPEPVRRMARNLRALTRMELVKLPTRMTPTEDGLRQLGEFVLRERYAELAPGTPAEINRHEVKVYSQNGEDGILLFLFSRLGAGTRRFVEFGFGDGSECNTANLSLNFGWSGLLMDGSAEKAQLARGFYDRKLGPRAGALRIEQAWITRDNINDLLRDFGVPRDLDLLSIDVDGNDYWVWNAIDAVEPRVLVIEYNSGFGCERAVTVPYDPAFRRREKHPSGYYFGASLRALVALGREKGYRFVGCDSSGVNAFFVREALAEQAQLSAVEPCAAFFPCVHWGRLHSPEEQRSLVGHLEVVEVPA